jgi:SAM-dependent methyltransferase
MADFVSARQSMPDLSRRGRKSEWLDGVDLSPVELERYLRDLARFNSGMLGRWIIVSWLRSALQNVSSGEPLTLLDVGCGNGDLLRAIRRWARRRSVRLRLLGLDCSRETIRIARAATEAADEIDYRIGDIFVFKPDMPVDFVVSSLLTHHLSDQSIVEFLRWMEGISRKGWFIYDLQRHAVPYHFMAVAGAALRLHPMVVHDGRVSVTRSLTRGEWNERIADAGIAREAVHLHWFLYRLLVGRLR